MNKNEGKSLELQLKLTSVCPLAAATCRADSPWCLVVWCKMEESISIKARTTSTSPFCRALKKTPVPCRSAQLSPWPIPPSLCNLQLNKWPPRTWRGARDEAHSPGFNGGRTRRWRWVGELQAWMRRKRTCDSEWMNEWMNWIAMAS